MSPDIEIKRAASEPILAFAVLGIAAAFLAFSYALWSGILVAVLVLAVFITAAPRYRAHIAKLPPPLVVDRIGVHISWNQHRVTNIPWSDLEDIGKVVGGRTGPKLGFRVRAPEKYLGSFLRLNMYFSRFQIMVPMNILDSAPTDLIEQIRLLQKAYTR